VLEHVVGDLEADVGVHAEDRLGAGDLLGAEGGAVGLAGVLLGGCRPADDRAQRDEGRAGRLGLGGFEGLVQSSDVLVVRAVLGQPVDALDVPAVGLIPGADVLGEGDLGVVLDGDVVVVPQQREVAELLGAGERGGLGADALFEVAVGGEAPDVVVER